MNLDKVELRNLLAEKEIFHLYHANTVATSISFIQQGGLVSRDYIERNGLFQTPQISDATDKVHDVFDDLFLDTADLHIYFNRQNKYGPVSFKFDYSLLDLEHIDVWVTKDNPSNWKVGMTHEEKYFTSVDELNMEWDNYHRQRKMITIRKPRHPLFFDYIDCILVDDPQLQITQTGVVFFNEAVNALRGAYAGNEYLKSKFRTRSCSNNCYCRSNYKREVSIPRLNALFLTIN